MLTIIMEIIGIWFLFSVGTVMVYNGAKELYIRNFIKNIK